MTPMQVIRSFTGRTRGRRPDLDAVPAPKSKYAHAGIEPPLDEVLEDPDVRRLMRADRLDPAEVEGWLVAVQAVWRIQRRESQPAHQFSLDRRKTARLSPIASNPT